MTSTVLATSSTRWLNCATSFQRNLKRIVLACKSSLQSPTEGKKQNEMRILEKDIRKCYPNNTVVWGKGNKLTGKAPKENVYFV